MSEFSTSDNFLSGSSTEITIQNIPGLSTALTEKEHLDFIEQNPSPDPPDVGHVRLYSKTDNKLYFKDSSGNEIALGGGGTSISSWRFDNVVTGTPANGFVKFNNATPNAVTVITINILDKDGNSYRPLLEELNANDALYFQDLANTNAKFYKVTDATDNGTYFTVNVTFQQETSATNYSLNQILGVTLLVSGNSFNQSLNTTDSVQFAKVDITTASGVKEAITLHDDVVGTASVSQGIFIRDSANTLASEFEQSIGVLSIKNYAPNGVTKLAAGSYELSIDEATGIITANTILNTSGYTVSDIVPTITLKDTNSVGPTAQGQIFFKDSVSTTQGSITLSNGDFNITNLNASKKLTLTTGVESLIIDDAVPLSTFSHSVAAIGFKANNGAASAPSLSFTNDPNTGLYSSAADILGVAVGGSSKLLMSAANSVFFNDLDVASGSTYQEAGVNSTLVKTGLGGANNYVVGTNAGAALTIGVEHIMIGTNAGASVNTGTGITVVGNSAHQYNTAPSCTAIGHKALQGALGISTGGFNTAIGNNCLQNVRTATSNTAIGHSAGVTLHNGQGNIFIGVSTDTTDLNALNRIAIGANASADADNHCVFGAANQAQSVHVIKPGVNGAGTGAVDGCDLGAPTRKFKDLYLSGTVDALAYKQSNTAATLVKTGLGGIANYVIGGGTGAALSTGTRNIMIGENVGAAISSQKQNVLIGTNAGLALTSDDNVAVGDAALASANTGFRNTAIGKGALNLVTQGSYNASLGYSAGNSITIGQYNTCLGSLANVNAIGSNYRMAIGYSALSDTNNHCVIGSGTQATTIQVIKPGVAGAGTGAVDGCDLGSATRKFKDLYLSGTVDALAYKEGSTAATMLKTGLAGTGTMVAGIGAGAALSSAPYSIIIGRDAGKKLTVGTSNVFIGDSAGYELTGQFNVCVGPSAGYGTVGSTGSRNSLFGGNAGDLITTGSDNVCVGNTAGTNMTSGSYNTLLGSEADTSVGGGNYRVALGFLARSDADNHMVIGSSTLSQTVQVIKPGYPADAVNGCDLGTATSEFKNLYLAGSIVLSNPPPIEGAAANLKAPTVAQPTIINANEITTPVLKVTAIEAEPSVTQITFNQPIIVQQGITIPPTAPASEIDQMDVTTLKIKNATNSNCLSYSATADQVFDLAQVETNATASVITPPTMSSPTLINTDGTFTASASTFQGGFDAWKAFDHIDTVISNAWASQANYTDSTGIYNGAESTNGFLGDWLQIQLPYTIEVATYRVTKRDLRRLSPTTWKLFSSNDGATWTEIDSKVDYVWASGSASMETVEFTPAVPGITGSYLRFACNQVGHPETAFMNVCVVAELSFTSASACPSSCLHVRNEMVVSGDVKPSGNLVLGGGITALSNIYQDTNQSVYGYVVMNDKTTPPSFAVPTPTGDILFNAFDAAREFGYNVTLSTSSITVGLSGTYEITWEGSLTADANGSYDLCLYVNGVCVTYTTSSDLKDTDNNKSLIHVQNLSSGDVVDVRLADASAAINVVTKHMALMVKRILVNHDLTNPPALLEASALLKEESKEEEKEAGSSGWFSL